MSNKLKSGLLIMACLCWYLPNLSLAQASPNENLQRGVVVETVVKGFEGERAGVQEGDVFLSWSRGDAEGKIESPFDFDDLQVEQGQRGAVVVDGLRGGEKKTWLFKSISGSRAPVSSWGLTSPSWGLSVRPNFSDPALSMYRQALAADQAGDVASVSDRWHKVDDSLAGVKGPWLAPWLLMRQNFFFVKKRQWNQADELFADAVRQAVETGPVVRAQILYRWALTLESRNLGEAEKYCQQALKDSESSGKHNLASSLYSRTLGAIVALQNDWPRGEKYLQQGLANAERVAPNTLAVAFAMDQLSGIAQIRGNNLSAENYARGALAIYQQVEPESLDVAGALSDLAYGIMERGGDLGEAETHFRQALELYQKLKPDSGSVAWTWLRLAILERRRSDLVKDEEYLQQALKINEKLEPAGGPRTAKIVWNLALNAHAKGDLSRAEEYYSQALTMWQKFAPDGYDTGNCLVGLGDIALSKGDVIRAEEYYRKAEVIQKNIGPESGFTALALEHLADVERSRGNLEKAERYLRRALKILEKLEPAGGRVADTLSGLGEILFDRGELDQAEAYQKRALQIWERISPDGLEVSEVLSLMGAIAKARGNLAVAETYQRKSLAIRERLVPGGLGVAGSLRAMADILREQGHPAQAEEYYRRVLEIREKFAPGNLRDAEILFALAETTRQQGRPREAEKLYEQALNALENEAANLSGNETVRAGFRAKHESYYRNYIDLLISENQIDRAFEALERSRAHTLLEMLTSAHVDVRQGADPDLISQERSLQASIKVKSEWRIRLLSQPHTDEQIKPIEKEIADLTSEYQDVKARLRSSSPGYAALTQPQPLSANEIQRQLLDPDTLLLEYSLGEERSHVFVVTSESLAAFELPRRKVIEQTARRLYGLLTERNRSVLGETELQKVQRPALAETAYKKIASELSRMILGSVAEQMRGKRLLVVGDGALHYVPFAALPEPGAASDARQVPLAVNHEIVNLPSASVLAVLRQQELRRQPAAKAVAVLADPVFASTDPRVKHDAQAGSKVDHPIAPVGSARERKESKDAMRSDLPDLSTGLLTRSAGDVGLSGSGTLQLPRLPFSRREAEAIMAVTPEGLGMKAVDFDANRETATSPELAQYRIVHFATHGLLDSQHPELSGLVLSLVDRKGQRQDGFLQLQDIYNLNLPADLVVLSACETGLGKEVNGEGLIGMTRGFMYAGATRVVSSLWKVDDFATAKLMKAFYTSMERDGKRPAEALREAQLSLINDRRWSSPYYWAGFTIQGEWK